MEGGGGSTREIMSTRTCTLWWFEENFFSIEILGNIIRATVGEVYGVIESEND